VASGFEVRLTLGLVFVAFVLGARVLEGTFVLPVRPVVPCASSTEEARQANIIIESSLLIGEVRVGSGAVSSSKQKQPLRHFVNKCSHPETEKPTNVTHHSPTLKEL
jgi:hypothetical protein